MNSVWFASLPPLLLACAPRRDRGLDAQRRHPRAQQGNQRDRDPGEGR